MKTVDNRTNAPPLDHVGVINETAELTREETRLGYPQRYPALMANAARLLCRKVNTFVIL